MKKSGFSSEMEVAAVVVRWLEDRGWTTYKEVDLHGDGVADIVAVSEGSIWIIETKRCLTTALVAQAYHRLRHAHYVSIAAPQAQTDRSGERIIDYFCRGHGIGRMGVRHDSVYEEVPALAQRLDLGRTVSQDEKYSRYERAKNIRLLKGFLCDGHKLQRAGDPYGKRITAYKQTVDAVRSVLRTSPKPLQMKEIVEKIKHHYSSASAARSSLAQRLIKVEKDFTVTKGLWSLKEGQPKPCKHGIETGTPCWECFDEKSKRIGKPQ